MPVISRFKGMIVKMYFLASEHNPPHIHVVKGERLAVIDIQTAEMIEGDLPKKSLSTAIAWTIQNKDALLEMWNTQDIKQLPPLK